MYINKLSVLLLSAYFRITSVLRSRSLSRLEEGVKTVIEEVMSNLERDSHILNATASIISLADNFDIDATLPIIKTTSPLLETMQMHSKQLNFFMDTVDVIDKNIYCDKLHINQVLLNLLSNAIKFTLSGSTVALTIRQKPHAPKGAVPTRSASRTRESA